MLLRSTFSEVSTTDECYYSGLTNPIEMGLEKEGCEEQTFTES